MEKPILKTHKVSKQFGSLVALDNINIAINEGELKGLIGPNGAGKSTLFKILIGYLRPTSGKTFFREKEITHFKPHEITRLGISSSFQISNMFPSKTIFQNMLLGFYSKNAKNGFSLRFKDLNEVYLKEAIKFSKKLGIEDYLETKVSELSFGTRKLAELCLGLSLSPTLLILDEPLAGLTEAEREKVKALTKDFLKSSPTNSVFIIDHDVELLMDACTKMIVMHEGRVITEGRPNDIRNNKKVREVYLGEVK